MKPLPFPLALHLGTDIVHIPRIARLVTRPGNYLARFTRRILCAQEQRDFTTRFALPPSYTSESLLSQSQRQSPTITPDMTRWLAGRFAAKEAARKAAPTGGAGSIGWKDVMVRAEEEDSEKMSMKKGKSSRPEIVFLGVGGEEDRLARNWASATDLSYVRVRRIDKAGLGSRLGVRIHCKQRLPRAVC
ncbi:4'-phosphopantetheinyl transferase [Penicillium lagena]|uniref:4'-phosphopantetheinyl transferase n=1 Tax=Penicillium lagena TaxID=94218 RepID=UPI002540FAFF|nr:4'-phosphopantetheinyl transferase [Penicillium lagena]KAJ5604939.1 4'-phosphopantetheinyl transferase [Penicillium lagena]